MARKQAGFTLIELLISMVLGLAILLFITALYSNGFWSNTKAAREAKVRQEMGVLLSLMEEDIKRAGFWSKMAQEVIDEGTTKNPHLNVAGSGLPLFVDAAVPATCILFAYDTQNSATGDPEYVGYRYDATNKGILYRTRTNVAHPTTTPCSEAGWENIVDQKLINVTALNFTVNYRQATGGSMKVPEVLIEIAAQDAADNTIKQVARTTVSVRNAEY